MWAPDCVQGSDGKFYLYFCFGFENRICVARSDSPDGHFSLIGCVKHADGRLYGSGIVSPAGSEYLAEGKTFNSNVIFVQKDRRARKVPSSEVYTVQEAKDFLLLFQIVWAELIVPMALVLANPDFSFVSGIVAALEEAIERDVWLF